MEYLLYFLLHLWALAFGLFFLVHWEKFIFLDVIFSDSNRMSNSEAGANNFGEAKNGGTEGMDIEVNLQPEKIVEVFRFEVRRKQEKAKVEEFIHGRAWKSKTKL